VLYSSFENCIKIKKRSALEPDAIKYKCYSPSVKNVVLETDTYNTTRVELINIKK